MVGSHIQAINPIRKRPYQHRYQRRKHPLTKDKSQPHPNRIAAVQKWEVCKVNKLGDDDDEEEKLFATSK
jgi:hypothetical protein